MNNNTITIVGIMVIVAIGMGLSLYYISRVNTQLESEQRLLSEIRKANNDFRDASVKYFDNILTTQIKNEENSLGNLTRHRVVTNQTFTVLEEQHNKILDILNHTR